MGKLKQSAIRKALWRKKEIAKSLRKLRHLHEKSLKHGMSKLGMKGPQTHDALAHTKYAKEDKKKKEEMVADDEENQDMENILNGRKKEFKKPSEWCLHFHAKCRSMLHDRLMDHNKVLDHATTPEPVSRYTKSLGLLTSPKIEDIEN